MKGFILEDFETGEKDDKGNPKKSSRLWDAQRGPEGRRLHGEAQRQDAADRRPRVAVPLSVPDPRSGGERRVQGGFERDRGVRAGGEPDRAKAGPQGPKDYWGGGPYLDTTRVHRSRRRCGRRGCRAREQAGRRSLPGARSPSSTRSRSSAHVQLYQATTAQTAVARMHPVKPFDDKRVRQAMRYAIDTNAVLQLAHKGLGSIGEHHHVSPIHPEYAKLPAVPAGRREGEEAPGRRRLPERDRYRDRVQARSRVGAARGAGDGGAVEGRGHPRQDQQSCRRPSSGRSGRRCRSASRPGPTGRSARWSWASPIGRACPGTRRSTRTRPSTPC